MKSPPALSEAPWPSGLEWLAEAQGHARAWNPGAKLTLVSTFEGDLPHYTTLDGQDRWGTPYYGNNDTKQGDGRASTWSYSFAVDHPVRMVAVAICDQGVHAEIAESYVVTLDHEGALITSYTSRNDDEGAIPTGFLPGKLISSDEAAAIAAATTQHEDWAADARWSTTFLFSQWYWPQPAWVFIFDIEDFERRVTAVDATNGQVLHDGPPPAPRC